MILTCFFDYRNYPYKHLDYFLRNITKFTFDMIINFTFDMNINMKKSIIFQYIVYLMKTNQWQVILKKIKKIPFSWNEIIKL